jgi:hypothetical protein
LPKTGRAVKLGRQLLDGILDSRVRLFGRVDMIGAGKPVDVERDPMMRRRPECRRLVCPRVETPGGVGVVNAGIWYHVAANDESPRGAGYGSSTQPVGEITDVAEQISLDGEGRGAAIGFRLPPIAIPHVPLCGERPFGVESDDEIARLRLRLSRPMCIWHLQFPMTWPARLIPRWAFLFGYALGQRARNSAGAVLITRALPTFTDSMALASSRL